jgi:hypothetical protein
MSFYTFIDVFGTSQFVRLYTAWAWRLRGCNKVIYFFERMYDILFNLYWRQPAFVSHVNLCSHSLKFLNRYLKLMIGRTRQLLQEIEETLTRLCMPFLVRLKLKRSGK